MDARTLFLKVTAAMLASACVGMARVARFILGQTDSRECVPCLMNGDNVV